MNREPYEYPRRILLAVTGLSPQVVTETLYALAMEQDPSFVPTEVHLVTTAEGVERARLSLFSSDPGWYRRLLQDYGLPDMGFDESSIHVVNDGHGGRLADIRSPEDNIRVADLITDRVRMLTTEEDSALHVSIAGGRKTMGYYLGYALSLFGRPQDRLSHVLVSEPFESSWDFFYPTPDSHVITTRDNKLVDTGDALVTLAEIPFVRLRDELKEDLFHGDVSFSHVVEEAQRALPPVGLALDPALKTVAAGGEEVVLKPAAFAFYWMLGERARTGRPGVHWSQDIHEELLDYYGRIVGGDSGDYERAEQAFERGITKETFDSHKTRINQALKRVLGRRHAEPYLIRRLDAIPGKRYHRYGLTLSPGAIRVSRAEAASRRHSKSGGIG